MKRKSFDEIECGIAQALERVGDVWSFLILRDALFGIDTFEGYRQSLGISRNTLSVCLDRLVDNGLMSRRTDPQDARRVIYRPEQPGEELIVVLVALSQWGNKWVYGKKSAPSFVADQRSAKPVQDLSVLDEGGRRLKLRDLRMILGPSGSPKLKKAFAFLFDGIRDA